MPVTLIQCCPCNYCAERMFLLFLWIKGLSEFQSNSSIVPLEERLLWAHLWLPLTELLLVVSWFFAPREFRLQPSRELDVFAPLNLLKFLPLNGIPIGSLLAQQYQNMAAIGLAKGLRGEHAFRSVVKYQPPHFC
jgi:hypothetical protein